MQTIQQVQDRSHREHNRRPEAPRISAFEPLERRCLFSGGDLSGEMVLRWNERMLQSLTSQPPLLRAPRNEALVHLAMFDAVNAIDRSFEPYAAQVRASRGASAEAAVAQAARDTLVALYPSRQGIFDAALAEDLEGIPAGRAQQGIAVGQEVARQILELRANDGSLNVVPYTPPNNEPGQWQPTDASPAAGAFFATMTPFAVQSHSQFLPGPPPDLDSEEYATDFNEVKTLGSLNSTERTADQTLVARLWQPALVHFQVWNRIAQDVVRANELSLPQTARLFALMDVAVSDALGTSFTSKFEYALWRPVTAIHRADEDGNGATEADPTWTTLHSATPPYPTYAGNAATIGFASATVLAGVLGSDDIAFNIDWTLYNPVIGVTRSYAGFSAAADESADSRIYGGIHFRFDSVAGQQIGTDVAGYVMDNILQPRPRSSALLAHLPAAGPSPFANGAGGIFGGGIRDLVLFESDAPDIIGST